MNKIKTLTTLFALFWAVILAAQTDSTFFPTPEEMPRFPGCEDLEAIERHKCAEKNLLDFIYQNIRYPETARLEGIQGTVVINFVVEKDGTVSEAKVVKDIGGGCGAEGLRVVNGMNELGIRWIPGKQSGVPVRVQFNLPIKFKLEDPLPYMFIGRDTVYVEFEDTLSFKGGHDSLTAFVQGKLSYPPAGLDSCLIGDMIVELLVQPGGRLKVLNVNDYNDLGFDYQFEAIRAANSTYGKWIPAKYKGRTVPTAYDVPVLFEPKGARCASEVESYKRAGALAEEGLGLYNEGKKEEGLAKLSEAINLFPQNANFRYLRGQIYLNEKQNEKACEDLQIAKRVLAGSFLDSLLPLICK